jgi:hypothetical protein
MNGKISPLTDEQAQQVARRIYDTSNNVYRIAEEILGRKLNDEGEAVYEQVEKVGKIFKCSECNIWKSDSEKCEWRDDCCIECSEEEEYE